MASSYRFVVSGQVQGVGFRWSAVSQAQRLGLGGWIANRADGAVEGVAGGADERLEAFRAWLQQGPRGAQVERVEWTQVAEQAGSAFEIRR